MSHKHLDSRQSIDSFALQLRNWRPFHLQNNLEAADSKKIYSNSNGGHTKRPCLSNRATSFSIIDAATIDVSRLSLIDDDSKPVTTTVPHNGGSYRLIARKRRRRGSKSVSGQSSDRSGTRRCCSVGASAAYGTCSDFPVAVGTDSSGELFVNGELNWASDVSEAKNSKKDRDNGNGSGEKENSGVGFGQVGCLDAQGNESGYGSEPGYRGDAELGDEFDEEEEDAKLLFWGNHFEDTDSKMEMVGENTFSDQKSHHRCRRKKHDCRMLDSLR